jgi:hypothetical protein
VLGLVFAEAAIFYTLAALFRRRSANVYFAALAACGAMWQFLGYFAVPGPYYTMLYATLGIACLIASRVLGLARVSVYNAITGSHNLVTRGRGLAPFQMGNAILLLASLAAVLQGLNRTAAGSHEWRDLWALVLTALATSGAVGLSPSGMWRRTYVAATIALGAVTFLTLNVLIDLTAWQKLEIFCVSVGLVLIVASCLGRFRETGGTTSEIVSVGLWLGSVLATAPLVTAVIYYRFLGFPVAHFSALDELVLFAVTVLMLVTGFSWQIKSTTVFGGLSLVLYLVIVVVSLGWRQQVAAGVHLAIGGALLFAVGIVLSIYRERLLQLPERIADRRGVFRILNWR